MAKHRRTEIAKITDPAKRRVTFSKRRAGLFSKTKALCELTAARTAAIVFSQTGKVYSFGKPSVEPVISDYLRSKSELMPPKGPREWVSWLEKELDPCATKEDLDFLEAKCETFLDCVRKQLEEVGAGGYCPVGSSGAESAPVHSLIEGCTYNAASGGSSGFSPDNFVNLPKDCTGAGDRDGLMAVGGGSSREQPGHSDLEGYGYNPDDFAGLEDLVSIVI